MKRYKAINFEYDDAYGTGTALDIVEHDEGEFVKFDDIKHLLQNTSSNSDYAVAVKNLINSEVDCVQTKNGAYVNLDGVIDCLNHALHDFA